MPGSPANVLIHNRSARKTESRRKRKSAPAHLFTCPLQLRQTACLCSSHVSRCIQQPRTFSQLRGSRMKTWKKPVVREVNCGAEINCYVSGEF
ncbi:pyrroloquinoline quinone precursor peptide PqqA [Xanthomonas prunicola]|nr:pyrroloquinoline quinone precursor peptide PqqA [Xanthomonas prunicola]